MSKQLKLKNYFFINNVQQQVVSIQEWLTRLNLHGSDSRNRTRFVKLLVDRITEIDKERLEMLRNFADKKTVEEKDKETGKMKKVEKVIFLVNEKDENGRFIFDPKTNKPKVKRETLEEKEGDVYKISDESNKKFEEEWKKYLEEELILDVTPATNETIYGARDIILKTTQEFSGRMGVLYDEWCTAFENISDSKKAGKKEGEEPKELKE